MLIESLLLKHKKALIRKKAINKKKETCKITPRKAYHSIFSSRFSAVNVLIPVFYLYFLNFSANIS